MNETVDRVRAIEWCDDCLRLLDQRYLPREERFLDIRSAADAAAAMTDMVVRGAPAIGITAAYGVVLSARANPAREAVEADIAALSRARPTAVNLHWALERMRAALNQAETDPVTALAAAAVAIHQEDIEANRCMGALGAQLIEPGSAVLTHCNTGSLATGGYGTALGVIRTGYADGRVTEVYADETRPWLQGSRLTAWELQQDRIPVTLIADSAAATLMQRGRVQWVIVGADRVAANGDVANKIGTYALAVLARHHGVRFMVVAPTSTIDFDLPDGAGIPIEDRDPVELTAFAGTPVAPADTKAWNPVFDVTPAALIDALVTERGVAERPDSTRLAALRGAPVQRRTG